MALGGALSPANWVSGKARSFVKLPRAVGSLHRSVHTTGGASALPQIGTVPNRVRSRRSIATSAAPEQQAGDDTTDENIKVTVYGAHNYVLDFLEEPLKADGFAPATFISADLDAQTAKLAKGSFAIIIFVNDHCSRSVVEELAAGGVQVIAMRCAGYDQVDIQACEDHGITVVRVPTYAPPSVAEHAVTLLMALNRSIPVVTSRVQSGNFAVSGLVGRQICGQTAGVVGTGAIGTFMCKILTGLGCRVIAQSLHESQECRDMGVEYTDLDTLLAESDIVTLHCPLLPDTENMINARSLALMKADAILINASRGGLIDTEDVLEALTTGKLGGLGIDVYEGEDKLFFSDRSAMNKRERMKTWDAKFAYLRSLPNVLITPHIAFLTVEALDNIASTTIENITAAWRGDDLPNRVEP